jgi:uncharacterized tellurite resistance protein B-like protein
MKQYTDTRIENAKKITKENLINKIKSFDSIRFDQMLIESEERKTYYFVKYNSVAFSRRPLVLKFPLYKELVNDFERCIEDNGEIKILADESILQKIKSKGKDPLDAPKYTGKDAVFKDLNIITENDKIKLKQPIYYIPSETERCTCNTCNGAMYNSCTEIECRGQHIYDCSQCRTAGKIDCNECRARGEYTCPSCHGRGRLRCVDCGGSGNDRNSSSKLSKCKSCNGSGERKCSSFSGHGLLGAAVKKAAGNEYCGGSGIIRCSKCSATGKITCGKCEGDGRIECKTCYGDHKDNRYGKVDCITCETAGELASISYIETEIKSDNLDLIFTDGKIIDAPSFGVSTIKKHTNSNSQLTLTYKFLNGEKIEAYDDCSTLCSKNALNQIGSSKEIYPKLISEEMYYEGVPCSTFNYNHILSASYHDVSLISIDKEQEVIFHSNPTAIAEEKESLTDKINELFLQAFSTKSYRDKIDRKHEMFLMVHMAKADGVIEEEEKRYLSQTITGLHGFTRKEKAQLFGLMTSSTLPPILSTNAYFSTKERAEEARKKIVELVAKADGDYEPSEKAKLDEINNAIELGYKAKPTAMGRFFKTWQISIPIIFSVISMVIFTYWFVLLRPIEQAADLHSELLSETQKIELFLSGDSLSESGFYSFEDVKNKILELNHESTLTFSQDNREISYIYFWSEKKKTLLLKVEELIKVEPSDVNDFSGVSGDETLPEFIPSEFESDVTPLVSKVYFHSKPSADFKLKSFFVEGQLATLLGHAGEFSKIRFTYNDKTTIAFVLSNEIIESEVPADIPDGEYHESSEYGEYHESSE